MNRDSGCDQPTNDFMLSSHLNMNFVCLFVCLSVCHEPAAYCKLLPTLILCVLRHVLIKNHSRVDDMNHGQSNSSMATTRAETIHGHTYLMARTIHVTTWQSVDAVCLCCLTHSTCVEVTGLQSLLTTVRWRLPVAHVKEDG